MLLNFALKHPQIAFRKAIKISTVDNKGHLCYLYVDTDGKRGWKNDGYKWQQSGTSPVVVGLFYRVYFTLSNELKQKKEAPYCCKHITMLREHKESPVLVEYYTKFCDMCFVQPINTKEIQLKLNFMKILLREDKEDLKTAKQSDVTSAKDVKFSSPESHNEGNKIPPVISAHSKNVFPFGGLSNRQDEYSSAYHPSLPIDPYNSKATTTSIDDNTEKEQKQNWPAKTNMLEYLRQRFFDFHPILPAPYTHPSPSPQNHGPTPRRRVHSQIYHPYQSSRKRRDSKDYPLP
eukprot:TRINITY_DN10535_c0_g2_i1.p1 TRINITY_DN10535_c0_g2~~TRINITY_DN10535_c0_g2_i1.p1  ORF type:complete len:290 (-),score=36.67 TRINITY_DN10535_c0_g2_i1:60-929(-)